MRLRTTLLLGLLTGCATTSASKPEATPAEAPAPASAPDAEAAPAPAQNPDLKAMAARELPPLPKQKVTAPDGSFTGEVEGAGAPSFQRQEDFLILSVPLGTKGPLTCFVYAEPLDAGGTLTRLLGMVGQHTEVQRARTTDVRLVNEAPTVYAEAQYLVNMPQGKGAGQAKLMVHTHEQVPLVCTHDELGYTESFKRITSGLASSLKAAGEPKPAPRYAEFHVIRIQGHPVGFEWRTMNGGAGGSTVTEVETSLFLPRSAKELLTQDTVSKELADKEGRLVGRDYARATNGELDIQMSLEQVKGREYHYEGTHSGKSLKGEFTATQELATEPGSARVVREQLLPGKKKELTMQSYNPAANPAAPVPQVWRRESAEGREVTVEMGPVKAMLTVDARGMVEKAVVPMGSLEMVQERVSVSGTP
jgi:hypothetical protein